MSARRLLLLCYFYPPLAGGGVHRVLSFTRHLPARGWACTVVCAGEEDYWVTDDSLTARVPAGTEVIRVRGGSALSAWLRMRHAHRDRRSGRTFGGLRRLSEWLMLPDSYVGWARRARRAAERRVARGGIDAVLSSSPPDSVQLAGLGLHRRTGLPWVADFRDPWLSLVWRHPPTRWHRARQAAMERAVIEGADVVLAASRTHVERMGESSGAHAREVLHLPNGFEPAPPGEEAVAGDPEHFQIVYTGTLSLQPDLPVVLEGLHGLFARLPEARRRVRARLAGPYDTDLADRALALGLTGIVTFAGAVSHAEARALQRGADVLLLLKPADLPTMVPGKLYEYLDAGRPVLGLLHEHDEAAALVRRAGGAVVPHGDAGAVTEWLERRYLAWRAGERTAVARPPWIDEHRRDRLAARLADVLDRLVAGARA